MLEAVSIVELLELLVVDELIELLVVDELIDEDVPEVEELFVVVVAAVVVVELLMIWSMPKFCFAKNMVRNDCDLMRCSRKITLH